MKPDPAAEQAATTARNNGAGSEEECERMTQAANGRPTMAEKDLTELIEERFPDDDKPDGELAEAELNGGVLRNRATAQQSFASEPSILDRFAEDLHKAGLVGEERSAKLLYLVLTSRLLDRPISAAVKAPSAAGKSYLVDTVLSFFPPSAFYTVTGMSERALVYSEEPLKNRVIVIYEAAGMAGDGFAPYFLRSLLSEGHIRYETVEAPKGGKPKGVVIEREGPTGAILTTTRVKLDPELETRLLSIPVTDSARQTKAVMFALAEEDGKPELDLLPWHNLQQLLADEGNGVTIPFSRELAAAIPPAATRLRRDFGAILGLIRAHALLHRGTRERDEDGRTIAVIEDYSVVRVLVADLISEGVGRTVSPETRETVQAVEGLAADHEDGVRQTALAAELELDRGTVSRRVRKALDGGYLRNLEEHRGRPHRLLPGEPLPEEQVILPEAGELHACTVAATPPPQGDDGHEETLEEGAADGGAGSNPNARGCSSHPTPVPICRYCQALQDLAAGEVRASADSVSPNTLSPTT